MGAESLLGKGDMLFTPPGMSGIVRIHAPWSTEAEISITPRHYSYLKISRRAAITRCAFCIIPSLHGDLVGAPPRCDPARGGETDRSRHEELLVISQDTSAYGARSGAASWPWKGGEVRAHMTDLARELGKLGAWVRSCDHPIPMSIRSFR